MSTKLTVLLSGVVGVDPRLLFLTTPASEAEVLQPGFMNTIEDVSGVDISPGDFIFTLYENGAKRELFIADFGPNRVITLQGIAGEGAAPGGVTGGVNLGSGQGIYAGVDGSDLEFKSLRAGTNITLLGSGTEITINAAGGGGGSNFDYEDTWFVGINGNDANDGKSINTPKATLQGCQAAFTSTRNVINVIDAGPYQDIDFLHESGDLIINAPGAKFETTESGPPLFWIQGGNLHLKVHEIQNSFSASAAILVNNGLLSIDSYKIGASGGPNAIYADGGAVYVNTHFLGASVQIGTNAYISTRYLIGDLITDDGINPGDLYVHANFESVNISGSGTVTGILGGVVYDGSTSVGLYVSKVNGSDVTGNGTFGNPYASITQALSVIGTPSIMTPIIIIDGETYEENVVIPEANIALIGPEATIAASLGDSIQITSASGANIINLFQIGGGGATNSISCTQTGATVFSSVDRIVEDIDVSDTGITVFINSKELDANITVAAGSSVNYTAISRTGTNTGDVVGTEADGTSGDWNVEGILSASGVTYPSAPATADGDLLFGNTDGTTGFRPASFTTNLIIPMSGFNYFRWFETGTPSFISVGYVLPTDSLNGAPFAGPTNRDFGNVTLNIPEDGTYRFNLAILKQFNHGIATFDFTGPTSFTEAIDLYDVGSDVSSGYQWEESLLTGTYTVNLSSFTKNPSSSDYNIVVGPYITVTKV